MKILKTDKFKKMADIGGKGDKVMDHAGYQKKTKQMSEETLRFIIKDAQEAIKANPENLNNGYYADEISYCSMELKRRQDGKKRSSDFTDPGVNIPYNKDAAPTKPSPTNPFPR